MMKDIPGYKDYAITEDGRVWSKRFDKWLDGTIDNNGYLIATLTKNKKQNRKSVHRLVLLTFLGKDSDPKKIQCDHIDGDPLNNNLHNLRWVTQAENQQNKKTAKGYSWNKKSKKWHAQITVDKKNIHLGCYDTEEEARQSYLSAKKMYHPTSPIIN